jgi:hypothetical protein
VNSSRSLNAKPIFRNNWLRDWLSENELNDSSGAYSAAKDPAMLADLVRRAQMQETTQVAPMGSRCIIAGRSLDLTGYLACFHPECLTRQVDSLFHRVWHYFDKIMICGLDAHAFLDMLSTHPDHIPDWVASFSLPIFHIREIGADSLVEWVSKPPACVVHWEEYSTTKEYRLPAKLAKIMAAALLSEGRVEVYQDVGLRLVHPDLYEGMAVEPIEYLKARSGKHEEIEHALAMRVVENHWLGAATDLYTASSMKLPIGMGIGLETRLATATPDSTSAEEVAFNLDLPILDGLPIRELLALRESEGDAFEGFRDSLTMAIKARLATEHGDPAEVAREVQADVITPALHRIDRRLHAAEGVLRKNHRYNIAVAGLATFCGVFTSPDVASVILAAGLTGAAIVESQFTSEKRDIAMEDMYFLWKAMGTSRIKS